MSRFTPESGHSYRSDLIVRKEGMACSVAIAETTSGSDRSVEVQVPQTACAEPGTVVANGVPMVTVFGVQFVPGNGKK